MKSKHAILFLAITVFITGCLSTDSEESQSVETLPVEEILTDITSKHPSNYFLLADRLLAQGNINEATRWYHIAQIRYIAYLLSDPSPDTSTDMAVYEAYIESIGIPLIYYAGDDIDEWTRTIEEALQWHRVNENGFTPKTEHPDIYASIEQGFSELSSYVSDNQSLIRRKRNRERDPHQHRLWSGVSLTEFDTSD